MALQFKDYRHWRIEHVPGTPGGETHIVADRARCFAFTRSHRQAVYALTGGQSFNMDDITDDAVDALLANGDVAINDDDCVDGYGLLGCAVWNGDGEFLGTVGDRCSNTAGQETGHPGYGRCRYHNGRLSISMAKHGRAAPQFRQMLKDRIAAYAQDPNATRLHRELAIQRALLDTLLERMTDEDDPDLLPMIERIASMADTVTKTVNRMSQIDHRQALTASQVVYVQITVVDVLRRYLPQDVWTDAAKELSDRLGTGASFGEALTTQGPATLDVAVPRTLGRRGVGA